MLGTGGNFLRKKSFLEAGKLPRRMLKKKKTTRRGLGKRKWEKKKVNRNFSIIVSNANGLSGKEDSLYNATNSFNKPSCITIQ